MTFSSFNYTRPIILVNTVIFEENRIISGAYGVATTRSVSTLATYYSAFVKTRVISGPFHYHYRLHHIRLLLLETNLYCGPGGIQPPWHRATQ